MRSVASDLAAAAAAEDCELSVAVARAESIFSRLNAPPPSGEGGAAANDPSRNRLFVPTESVEAVVASDPV